MSLSQELCHKTLNIIINRFGMEEAGSPYHAIKSQIPPGDTVGKIRIWHGDRVRKLVYVGITVPMMQLDSHMLFAFTAADSTVPHFTLDSVLAGPTFAFHLDLLPRIDLGSNLAYIDAAFHPLTDEYEKARKIEGLTEARLSPRQYAIMSPWMLAHRATEEAYRQVEPSIDFYRDHWAGLVENGIDDEVCGGETAVSLTTRDQRNRAAIFNTDVDPVWNRLEPLIGAELGAQMRTILQNQNVESL
ncbi:MAG: hypothetical protein GY943_23895 [Chloroflexi bacterium]|nr:hypothetical protein [Chloroflexota bacterium]